MKYLGSLKYFLGLETARSTVGIYVLSWVHNGSTSRNGDD